MQTEIQSITQTFYQKTIQGSNVVQTKDLAALIADKHQSFDIAEFSKDIREIDWPTVYRSLTPDALNAKWEIPEYK